jgi:Uma2 family endonuclease
MSTTIAFENQFELPLSRPSLDEFRRWALSAAYPARGRVDFVQGRIEIDMAAEELFTHGSPKVEITVVLGLRVKRQNLGHLFVADARVSNVEADLSAEPDIVFVSDDSIDGGRVRLISKAKGRDDRYTEVEGSPDMVAEIVSDSSVNKDTKHLHTAYHEARIPEYWLVDARRDELVFCIYRQGTSGYEAAIPVDEGYQFSEVFQCWFRLDRHRDRRGNWKYHLHDKEANGAKP